jgi:cell division protein ZapA
MAEIRVQILGKEYVLRSQEDAAHVRRVAEYFNTQLEEVQSQGNTASTQAATVLAALNITNELIRIKDTQEAMLQEIEAKSERLLEIIEQS